MTSAVTGVWLGRRAGAACLQDSPASAGLRPFVSSSTCLVAVKLGKQPLHGP